VEQAVSLALRGRWEEAVVVNDNIITLFPDDADAFNRLGKAYTELGRYSEARDAYEQTLRIDAFNTIARKNRQRLATLTAGTASVQVQELSAPTSALADEGRALPQLFLEAMGKTGTTVLANPAPVEVLARCTAGTPLRLEVVGNHLVATLFRGERLGEVERRLAQRLIHFIQAGNQYAAAITALDIQTQTVKVIIRETFQHPSMAGRVSFPPKGGGDAFRAYTKESLLKLDEEDDERFPEEGDYGVEAGPMEEPTEEPGALEEADADDD
jgi:hypothetical protein